MKFPDVSPDNPSEASILDSIDALESTIRGLEDEKHRLYLLLAETRARRNQVSQPLETVGWSDQLPDDPNDAKLG